jgi:hypothetical protein
MRQRDRVVVDSDRVDDLAIQRLADVTGRRRCTSIAT